jgi:hypothetical protein
MSATKFHTHTKQQAKLSVSEALGKWNRMATDCWLLTWLATKQSRIFGHWAMTFHLVIKQYTVKRRFGNESTYSSGLLDPACLSHWPRKICVPRQVP